MMAKGLIAVLVATLVSAAFYESRSDAEPDRAAEDRSVVGIWFDGMPLRPGASQADLTVFGLLVEVPANEPLVIDVGTLADGPIVGSFRSPREAWFEAGRQMERHGRSTTWYRAALSVEGWSFEVANPPAIDRLQPERQMTSQIGPSDRGLRSIPCLYLLPSPLAERGVSLVVSRPKANPRPLYLPGDRSTSLFTSWDDMERAIGDRISSFWLVGASGEMTKHSWEVRRMVSGLED